MKKKLYKVTLVYNGTIVTSIVESAHPREVFTAIIIALAKGATAIDIEEVSVISDIQLFRAMAKAL